MAPAASTRLATLRLRLRPEAEQAAFLGRHIGATRFVYNACIAYYQAHLAAYAQAREAGQPFTSKVPTRFDLQAWWKHQRDDLVADGETWLAELKQDVIRQGCARAATAIQRHLKGLAREPRFHGRHHRASAQWFDGVRVEGPSLFVSRQPIRAVWHRRLPAEARIVSVAISRSPAGAWHASILHETGTPQKTLPPRTAVVGVDLGARRLAATSDGTLHENPRPLKAALKRLRRQQRHLARCRRGNAKAGRKNHESARYRRARQKAARLHERVADTRRYHHQQVAYALVRDHGVICLETLDVRAMHRDRRLARPLADAALGALSAEIEKTAVKYGRTVVRLPKDFPSTQRCCTCGVIHPGVTLNVTTWRCPNGACQTLHDRDVNAARNLRDEGLKLLAAERAASGDGRPRVNDAEGADPRPGASQVGASDEPSNGSPHAGYAGRASLPSLS